MFENSFILLLWIATTYFVVQVITGFMSVFEETEDQYVYVYWDRIIGCCGGYYYCILSQGWFAMITEYSSFACALRAVSLVL